MDEQRTGVERVYQHIKKHEVFIDDREAPEALTTDGIAAALGMSRGHASVELRRLRNRGLVGEMLRYVPGRPRRLMKCYKTNGHGTEFSNLRVAQVEEIHKHLRAIDQILLGSFQTSGYDRQKKGMKIDDYCER